jgi:hypothetical protein
MNGGKLFAERQSTAIDKKTFFLKSNIPLYVGSEDLKEIIYIRPI